MGTTGEENRGHSPRKPYAAWERGNAGALVTPRTTRVGKAVSCCKKDIGGSTGLIIREPVFADM